MSEEKAKAAQEEDTAVKEEEAEKAPEAKEGAGPANIRDRGAAQAALVGLWASWETFRGDPDANGFFGCSVCGVLKKAERALQNHVWSKADDDSGHPTSAVQELWYPEWKTRKQKKRFSWAS